jgi:PhnB protein
MSEIELAPYLYFQGQAREAMEFYKAVFGGQLFTQSRAEVGMKDGHPDWLIHGRLDGGDAKVMASDTEQASAEAKKVELSLTGDDEPKLREIFERLSVGGKVESALKKEFWGDIFGKVTDRYGVIWMVNINAPKR